MYPLQRHKFSKNLCTRHTLRARWTVRHTAINYTVTTYENSVTPQRHGNAAARPHAHAKRPLSRLQSSQMGENKTSLLRLGTPIQ